MSTYTQDRYPFQSMKSEHTGMTIPPPPPFPPITMKQTAEPLLTPAPTLAPRTQPRMIIPQPSPEELSPSSGETSHSGSLGHGEGRPPVGSVEWLRRKANSHNEVERRRRETINEGIKALADIVPGAGKHKGKILSQAIRYISSLKDEAAKKDATIDVMTVRIAQLEADLAVSTLSHIQ